MWSHREKLLESRVEGRCSLSPQSLMDRQVRMDHVCGVDEQQPILSECRGGFSWGVSHVSVRKTSSTLTAHGNQTRT